MRILALDPSGEWRKGKGTTGYCYMVDGEILKAGEVKAQDFSSAPEYWSYHKSLIYGFDPDHVVCESYQLYNHPGKRAEMQSYSYMETPQLIGVITVACWEAKIPLTFQTASQAKRRWSDRLLVDEGYIQTKKGYSTHMLDAIRHAVHFNRYGKKAVV